MKKAINLNRITRVKRSDVERLEIPDDPPKNKLTDDAYPLIWDMYLDH